MKVKISTLFLLLIWTLSTSGCIPRILAKEFRHIELTREINSFEATRTSYRQTQIPSFKSDFRDIEPNLYQLEFTNFYMFFDMSKFKQVEFNLVCFILQCARGQWQKSKFHWQGVKRAFKNK